MAKAGLPMVKLNPPQARRFAEAAGKLAKTDRRDAALLARMGALLQLEVRPARNAVIAELKPLQIAREALVKDRTAAKNRSKAISLAVPKCQNAERLKHIERQMVAIEAEIESRIRDDAELARRFDILVTIPGVPRLTAFVLLIEMSELGTMEADRRPASPASRQSHDNPGAGREKPSSGAVGPMCARRCYRPAVVARRFNPDLKAKYDQLVGVGKPAKVAITAIMQKLIIMANAPLKAGRPWMPKTT